MSTRLARSAGLIGAATMTSRMLGVVREIVLAALFGAGNDMDAFNVAFRVPNLLRDLFAEGAMSAAFVPTFTRSSRTGREARGGSAISSSPRSRRHRSSASSWPGIFAPALVAMRSRPSSRLVPGKLELTVAPHPHHAAVSGHGRGQRRDDGHAQRVASFLHPRAVSRHVQRGDNRRSGRDRAVDAARWLASDRRHRRRYTARRSGADGRAVAGAASRRLAVPAACSTGGIRACAKF